MGSWEKIFSIEEKEYVLRDILWCLGVLCSNHCRFFPKISLDTDNISIYSTKDFKSSWFHLKSIGLTFEAFQSLLAAAEICRRCMWNLFRLEFEQMSNSESYRAVNVVGKTFWYTCSYKTSASYCWWKFWKGNELATSEMVQVILYS